METRTTMPSSPLGFLRKGREADMPSALIRMALRVVKAAALERKVVRRRTAYIMVEEDGEPKAC